MKFRGLALAAMMGVLFILSSSSVFAAKAPVERHQMRPRAIQEDPLSRYVCKARDGTKITIADKVTTGRGAEGILYSRPPKGGKVMSYDIIEAGATAESPNYVFFYFKSSTIKSRYKHFVKLNIINPAEAQISEEEGGIHSVRSLSCTELSISGEEAPPSS